MLRKMIFLLWLCLTALAYYGTARTVTWIAGDPSLRPFRIAVRNEIIAATERVTARAATPEVVEGRLRVRLAESPRNWVALDALTDLAEEMAIHIAPDLLTEVSRVREEDFGFWNQALSCGACAIDPGACSISQVMLCQAPVAMTPVGDVFGVVRAGSAYLGGEDVDMVDLALSAAGLVATAAILTSGGSSGAVKVGAGLTKVARKMGRLSPRLIEMATKAVGEGLDWAALPRVRSVDDLTRIARADAFAPLANTLAELERVWRATDATRALHLLPMVDNADDARHLANVAEALGPKVVARAEVLGKARLFRLGLRVANATWGLLSTSLALAVALAGLLTSFVEAGIRRRLRRLLRH